MASAHTLITGNVTSVLVTHVPPFATRNIHYVILNNGKVWQQGNFTTSARFGGGVSAWTYGVDGKSGYTLRLHSIRAGINVISFHSRWVAKRASKHIFYQQINLRKTVSAADTRSFSMTQWLNGITYKVIITENPA